MPNLSDFRTISVNGSSVAVTGGYVGITGNVPITFVNSGIGITGGSITVNNFPANTNITNTGFFNSGYYYPVTNLPSGVSGQAASFLFNKDNGALLVQPTNLDRTSDYVTAFPPVGSTITGQQGIRTGLGTVFNSNPRSFAMIQNYGLNPIYVALSGAASATNFSFVLAGGTTSGDGKGAMWTFNNYYGALSVTGSGISYTAFEF